MKKTIWTLVAAGVLTGGAGLVFGDDDGDRSGRKMLRESRLDVAPVTNAVYKEECGSCHFAYQPGLLPARSWKKVMAGLDQHFGDVAEVEPDVGKALTEYLVQNGADHAQYKRSVKIMNSLAAKDAPLRVSETPYFTRKHRELSRKMVQDNPKVKSWARCEVCHQRADEGSYNEGEIIIPGYGRWEDD